MSEQVAQEVHAEELGAQEALLSHRVNEQLMSLSAGMVDAAILR